MKILFVHSVADVTPRGGAEVTLWHLVRGLRDAGHECVIVATSDRPGLRRSERDGVVVWHAGIRNLYWPHRDERPAAPVRWAWHALDSFNPWMGSFIGEVVRRERPNVASVHTMTGWSVAAWTTLLGKQIPVVQVLHGHYLICPRATMYKDGRNCSRPCLECTLLRLPYRRLSQRINAVVGVSSYILQRHLSLGYFVGVPLQRVIHNVRSRASLGLNVVDAVPSQAGTRFGYIGRLDPAKGIETLLTAFRSLPAADVELWVAGTGDRGYVERLRTMTRDPRVRFCGFMSPRSFYPHVDVVVVPSLCNEALGMVAAEALAFGKPVIASRRGGLPEVIHDAENGLLYDPARPEELGRALMRLHSDPGLRRRLSAAAPASAEPFLDVSAWIRQYEDLYETVVASETHPLQGTKRTKRRSRVE